MIRPIAVALLVLVAPFAVAPGQAAPSAGRVTMAVFTTKGADAAADVALRAR